jgi:endo-alpha-1,4-polygalactosaminidase (GH114 family)
MANETKAQRTARFYKSMEAVGVDSVTADKLRRIEMTLRRWAELECGTGEGQTTYSIERDEDTGKPFYRIQYPTRDGYHDSCYPYPDKEKGALKRLVTIMATLPDLVPYHQSDPRGCALWLVPKDKLADSASIDSVYTRGVAVCID